MRVLETIYQPRIHTVQRINSDSPHGFVLLSLELSAGRDDFHGHAFDCLRVLRFLCYL